MNEVVERQIEGEFPNDQDLRAMDLRVVSDLSYEYGDIPDPYAEAIDERGLNRVLFAMKRIQSQIDSLTDQARAEHEAIDSLLEIRRAPLQSQLQFLHDRYRGWFEQSLEAATADGKSKSLKLLYATIKRKAITYAGSFRSGMEDKAVSMARMLGWNDMIEPERVIQEHVAWGEFKKQLVFRVDKVEEDGEVTEKVVAICKDTGEELDFVEVEKRGGDLEIKF